MVLGTVGGGASYAWDCSYSSSAFLLPLVLQSLHRSSGQSSATDATCEGIE